MRGDDLGDGVVASIGATTPKQNPGAFARKEFCRFETDTGIGAGDENGFAGLVGDCLLYTSDAADE